jgi:hypothetical protein
MQALQSISDRLSHPLRRRNRDRAEDDYNHITQKIRS